MTACDGSWARRARSGAPRCGLVRPTESLARRESVLGDLVTDAMRAGTGRRCRPAQLRHPPAGPPDSAGPDHQSRAGGDFSFCRSDPGGHLPADRRPTAAICWSMGCPTAYSAPEGFSRYRVCPSPSIPTVPRAAGWWVSLRRANGEGGGPARIPSRRPSGSTSACEGGDGYSVPEAESACGQRTSAPRAVDLLTRYITDSLGGRIERPKDSRVVEAGNDKSRLS